MYRRFSDDLRTKEISLLKLVGDFVKRHRKPCYNSDVVFRLSPLGGKQQKNLEILHGLTRSVIRTRKQELLVRSKHQIGEEEDHEVLGEEC